MTRQYYSQRTGKNPGMKFDFPMVLNLFRNLYADFETRFFFQEAMGFYCVDRGRVPGTMRGDIDSYFTLRLRKNNLWPIEEKYLNYSEDDLFDVIELLYDHVSKPLDGYFHDWNGCGWHYETFDKQAGQAEFRHEINEFLMDYGDGFELSLEGEILHLVPDGLESLVTDPIPTDDTENIENRINAAIMMYRRSRSSVEERRDAVRNLGDVLEYLRSDAKKLLKADEPDLFNILNNFGIRHHDVRQTVDYDQVIFLDWLFYHYLAAVRALLRLINQRDQELPF